MRRRRRTGTILGWVLALGACVAGSSPAQEAAEKARAAEPEELAHALEAEELEALLERYSQEVAPEFSENLGVLRVFAALDDGRTVRARELTEQMLAEAPDSIEANCLHAMVLYQAEGNLPFALYHAKRCRRLFEQRHGRYPSADVPNAWHWLAFTELARLSAEMGRQEDAVAYLAERDDVYGAVRPADRAWPLYILRRFDEARAAAEEGKLFDDLDQQSKAWTALCAIEAELGDDQRSYEACLRAVELDTGAGREPVYWTNAAEAARGLLLMDEAERLLLTATDHFVRGTVANPWMELMYLYMAQGRSAEALDAMREMFRWRNHQPPYVDVQTWATTDMASATFLLLAGHPVEASRLTRRSLEQPDRTGRVSIDDEQLASAAALLDRLANRTAAESRSEEASWLPFWRALAARADALRLRARAWWSGRRAAALFADDRILQSRIRPHAPGYVIIPEWIEPDLVGVLGPGVVAAALADARAAGADSAERPYHRAFETEIAFEQARHRKALDLAEEALQTLPGSEVLLLARVAAVGAQAALAIGERGRAAALFDMALQSDPGVLRRLGAALPCRFEAAGGDVESEALGHLRASPRLTEGAGFLVEVTGSGERSSACLIGPQGSVLACAQVSPRAGESSDDTARRLARRFHEVAFAPRIDLTQADLRSLDGATAVASGRGSERAQLVLSDLVDGAE